MKFLAMALVLLSSSMSYANVCKSSRENHKGFFQYECTLKTDKDEETSKRFILDAYRSTYSYDGITDTFAKSIVKYEDLYIEIFSGVSLAVTAYKQTPAVLEGVRNFCGAPDAYKEKTLKYQDRILRTSSDDSKIGRKKHVSKWNVDGREIVLECLEAQK